MIGSTVARFKDLLETRVPAVASALRAFRMEAQFRARRSARTPLGFDLVGDPSMQSGAFEEEETALVRDCLRRVDLFVDVGANVGYYTCLACAAGVSTIAIEPVPANLRVLHHNLRLNGWTDTEVWPVGVGAGQGSADIFGAGTAASLISGWAGNRASSGQTIAVTTLDRLLDSRAVGRTLLIKVDVEGAEYDLLRGATATLLRDPRPVWLVEIALDQHRPERNARFTDTFEMFWSRGYRSFTGDGDRREIRREDVAKLVTGAGDPTVYSWLFAQEPIG